MLWLGKINAFTFHSIEILLLDFCRSVVIISAVVSVISFLASCLFPTALRQCGFTRKGNWLCQVLSRHVVDALVCNINLENADHPY